MKRLAMLVVALVAVLAAPMGVLAAPGWTSPSELPLDTRSGLSYAASLDSLGHIHVAAPAPFYGPGLFYETTAGYESACCANGNRYSFVEAVATRVVQGQTLARIVWVDTDRHDALWLTRNDSGFWVSSRLWIGTADKPTVANLGNGIAVAFQDHSNRLRYLSWDPVTGPTPPRTVSSSCCTGATSVAVHAGRPAIAFVRSTRGADQVTLATLVSGHWSMSPVAHRTAWSISLAFAKDGVPVVAFEASNGVYYGRRKSSGWSVGKVLASQYFEPWIAADATGEVGVVATNYDSIVFRRVDVASPTVHLVTVPFPGEEGADAPYLGFHDGHAFVTYQLGCGCSDDGVYLTHQ